MNREKAQQLLGTPIDPTGHLDFQIRQRLSALFTVYDVPHWDRRRFERLAIALACERFPKTFSFKQPRSRDPRCKVPDLKALKALVDAIMRNDLSGLSPDLQKLGKSVHAKLKYDGKRTNISSICDAISRIRGSVWYERESGTLRDNLQRPPGTRSRRLAAQRLQRELIDALSSSVSEIHAIPDD